MPEHDQKQDLEPTRQDFAAFLMAHNAGSSHEELSDAFAGLLAAVRATGKKGSVTYTVTVVPDGRKNLENLVTVTDEIKVKAPEGERPSSVWFVTNDNRLSENHPGQEAMFNIDREY